MTKPDFSDEEPTTPMAYVTIDDEDQRWRVERQQNQLPLSERPTLNIRRPPVSERG